MSTASRAYEFYHLLAFKRAFSFQLSIGIIRYLYKSSFCMSLCLVSDYSGFTLALFLAARDVSPQRQQFNRVGVATRVGKRGRIAGFQCHAIQNRSK